MAKVRLALIGLTVAVAALVGWNITLTTNVATANENATSATAALYNFITNDFASFAQSTTDTLLSVNEFAANTTTAIESFSQFTKDTAGVIDSLLDFDNRLLEIFGLD